MKKLIKTTLALLISGLLFSCGSTAGITIPANQEFVLGEKANHGFSAKLNNESKYQVDISIIDSNTLQQTQGFGLPAKNSAKIYVSKDETVLLKNKNEQRVKVTAKLNRSVEGMRYQSVEEKSN